MEDGQIAELKIDDKVVPATEYSKLEELIVEMIPNGNRDIITVFPDCGDSFGNIYYLNKNKEILNLDGVLEDVSARMNEFENFKLDRFDFHADKFDNQFIDSLRIEIGDLDWDKMITTQPQIDSIFDLLPDHFPTLRDTLSSFRATRGADPIIAE